MSRKIDVHTVQLRVLHPIASDNLPSEMKTTTTICQIVISNNLLKNNNVMTPLFSIISITSQMISLDLVICTDANQYLCVCFFVFKTKDLEISD